eukprot:scaffold256_cov261-Pinguiococcus_pyrenoidosus.AAC.26
MALFHDAQDVKPSDAPNETAQTEAASREPRVEGESVESESADSAPTLAEDLPDHVDEQEISASTKESSLDYSKSITNSSTSLESRLRDAFDTSDATLQRIENCASLLLSRASEDEWCSKDDEMIEKTLSIFLEGGLLDGEIHRVLSDLATELLRLFNSDGLSVHSFLERLTNAYFAEPWSPSWTTTFEEGGVADASFGVGDAVMCRYTNDARFFPGKVVATSETSPTSSDVAAAWFTRYDILYDDGDFEAGVDRLRLKKTGEQRMNHVSTIWVWLRS